MKFPLFILVIVLLSSLVSATSYLDVADYYTEQEINNTFVPFNGSDYPPLTAITYLTFLTGYVPTGLEPEGSVYYDPTTRGLEYVIDEFGSITLGQEMWDYFQNLEGDTIHNGDVVSVIGVSGNRKAVKLTNASNTSLSLTTVAMVTVPSINNNQPGRVTTKGLVRGIDTSLFIEGTNVFIDCDNPGKLTQTIPDTPGCYNIDVGIVTISHPTEGEIIVDIKILPQLGDLSNVVGSCVDDEIIKYNALLEVWECSVDKDTNTNAGTICNDGEYLDGDTNCYNLANTYYNRSQVDELVGGINLDFFFHNESSNISTYNLMEATNSRPETSSSFLLSTSNTFLGGYITNNASYLGIEGLSSGIITSHFHANVNQITGYKDAIGYYELYVRRGNGTEELLSTSEDVYVTSTVEAEYEAHAIISNDVYLNTSDRILVKLYANTTGTGSNPTLTVYIQGTTASRMEVGTTGINFATKGDLDDYLKLDGSNANSNINISSNNFNTDSDITVGGNLLVGNPAISARIATSSNGTLGVLGSIAWDEAAFLLNDVFGYKLGFDGNQMVTDALPFNIQNDALLGGFRIMTGQDATNYAMEITHDNKVGINKNNPTKTLDVDGTADFTGAVRINPSETAGSNFLTVSGTTFPIVEYILKTASTTGASSTFRQYRDNGLSSDNAGTGFIYALNDDTGAISNILGLYGYIIDSTNGIETGGLRIGIGKNNNVQYAPALFSGDGLVLQDEAKTTLNWADETNNNEILTILEDDRNMCFGLSRDACMGYESSSTNFVIDPKNVGDGEVEIIGNLNLGNAGTGNWTIQDLTGTYWQRIYLGDTINLDETVFANQYRSGSGDFYDTFNSTGNGDFETLRDIKSGRDIYSEDKLFVNSDSSDILPIGAGGTAKMVVKDDIDKISGLQMTNVNNGTGADFRFLIKDPTGHYFAFSQPGTGNTVPTIFGLQRNTTDFIFNAGGTARDMGIGTATGQGKFVLASGGVNAVEISNSTQNLTLSSLAGTYTGGSAYVCVNNAGTIYASEVACP